MTYQHALAALLWSSTDPETGEPLDHVDAEPTPELCERVRADWAQFQTMAENLGFDAEQHCARMLHPDCEGNAWNAAAHDFILTRNHHGSGFWDSGRWCEPWGDKLTKLAHQFGELSCCVGPDGIDAE
jgi:hypothetical protein